MSYFVSGKGQLWSSPTIPPTPATTRRQLLQQVPTSKWTMPQRPSQPQPTRPAGQNQSTNRVTTPGWQRPTQGTSHRPEQTSITTGTTNDTWIGNELIDVLYVRICRLYSVQHSFNSAQSNIHAYLEHVGCKQAKFVKQHQRLRFVINASAAIKLENILRACRPSSSTAVHAVHRR